MNYIEVDGYKLRYHIEGSGPDALVIGSALYYQRSFSKALREHLRLVFMDWRGFAKTNEEKASAVTFDTLLEDIEQVRKKIGIKSCIVIGHSAHALLALEYAKKFPHIVSHVVMIAMSPNLNSNMAALAHRNWLESVWPQRKDALEKRMQALPDQELDKLPPAEKFIAWYVRKDPQAWYDYHFDSSRLWEGITPNMPLFDYLYSVALRDIDITHGLSAFNTPIFLALGRYDFIVAPPSAWDPIRDCFKDLTLRIFEHSGHSPHYEEAGLFNKELLHWISNVSTKK